MRRAGVGASIQRRGFRGRSIEIGTTSALAAYLVVASYGAALAQPAQKVHRDGFAPIDYLRGRPDVDPKRIAVAGYSLGAMIALRLGALDAGLAGTVCAAIPTTLQPDPTDPFHFAPRSATPTLLLIGRTDWLSSPRDAERLTELLASEDATLRFYDAGHLLPPTFATDAADWLVERLEFSPAAPSP